MLLPTNCGLACAYLSNSEACESGSPSLFFLAFIRCFYLLRISDKKATKMNLCLFRGISSSGFCSLSRRDRQQAVVTREN